MIFTIALRNLLGARRRTMLLGLAIAIVACLFLILRAVSGSVSERMVESATTLSSGHVNVGGFFKTRRKDAAPLLAEGLKLKDEVKAMVPEAESIIDRHRGWGRIISPAASINVGLYGIVYDQEKRFFDNLRLAPEREYLADGGDAVHGDFESLKEGRSILIFAAQAKKLDVRVGDLLTLVTEASGGQANTVDLRVGAIASDVGFMSNFNMYVPRQVILDLYLLKPDSTGSLLIYLPKADDSLTVMERLRGDLEKKGHPILEHDPQPFFFKFEKIMGEDWLGQKLDLTIWSDEISFVLWITAALDLVSFFVLAVLGAIICGGIINSMWMSVRERIKEIGTMRAVGARKSYIAGLFVIEAMLLGFLGAALGSLVGAVLLVSLNALHIPIASDGIRLFLMANELNIRVHASQVLGTPLLFAVLTGLSALYPAWKAARLRPVEALMHSK